MRAGIILGGIFYTFLAVLVIWAAWQFLAPAACPVPEPLLSQKGETPCFEFWFARYQTLLAIGPAIVVAWLTWQQIVRAEQRRLATFRERAAARYREMDKLIAFVNALADLGPRDELTKGLRLPEGGTIQEASLAQMSIYIAALKDDIRRRRDLLSQLSALLTGGQLGSEEQAIAERFAISVKDSTDRDQALFTPQFDPADPIFSDNGPLGPNNADRARAQTMQSLWYGTVDHAYREVEAAANQARAELSAQQATVVAELVSPPTDKL